MKLHEVKYRDFLEHMLPYEFPVAVNLADGTKCSAIKWVASHKDYRVQVDFLIDGTVRTEYSIPDCQLHNLKDSLSGGYMFSANAEMISIVGDVLCYLDELRCVYMDDEWKAKQVKHE